MVVQTLLPFQLQPVRLLPRLSLRSEHSRSTHSDHWEERTSLRRSLLQIHSLLLLLPEDQRSTDAAAAGSDSSSVGIDPVEGSSEGGSERQLVLEVEGCWD